MKSGPNRTRRIIFWGSSLPAVLAASFLYFPYCHTGPVFCPSALLFGLPCPGCGLTRALGHATHGQFHEAFLYHPIWPLILAYFVFLWIYQIAEAVKGEPPRLPTNKIAATAALALMVFWAERLVFFFLGGGLAEMAHDNALARLSRLLS